MRKPKVCKVCGLWSYPPDHYTCNCPGMRIDKKKTVKPTGNRPEERGYGAIQSM